MKGKGESMKISYNTGRRENIIGLVLWGIFIIVYCCAIYMLFRVPLIPQNTGKLYNLLYDLVTLCIILVSVIAALLTARVLFHFYLSLRAFHAHVGAGWQDWRNRKEKTADRETSGS